MKRFILFITIAFVGITLTGCGNKDLGFGNYNYQFASCDNGIIKFQNVEIQSWKDFEDGEQLEVTFKNGNKLLVSSNYCILSKEKIEEVVN